MLVWLFWVLLLQLISPSIIQESIQTYVADPVQFRLRQMLGKTPELSPQLKMFALDDGTVSLLKKPDVGLHDLSLLLENIARQKPKAILLDKMFSTAPENKEDEADIARIKQITPIYAGSWINQIKIKYRSPRQLTEEAYGAKRWLKPGENWNGITRTLHDMQGYIYAYDDAFEGAFAGIGHLGIDRNRSVIFPFLLYQSQYLLPHLSLYAADSIAVGRNLEINGQVVPLKENGAVYLNHRPVTEYYATKNMRSMRKALERARQGEEESWVKEGDVVVILFNFFTGSTDIIEGAPFGELPGGLLIATLVDSVMEHRWLHPMGSLPWLIILATLLGTALARYSGPMQYWAILSLVIVLWFGTAIYLFSYHSIITPWLLPMIGMMGGGMIQYIYNRLGSEWRVMEMENQYLQERARRLEEEKAKVQFAERLNLGRAVQEILLPPQKEQVFGCFTLAMSYQPAQEMSGDWIYLWQAGEDERRLILGDVVGKGPSAAIPVAVIIGILGECEGLGMSIHSSLERVNQRLVELFDKQISSSCTAISLHRDGRVELYNAGSPGWFLRQPAQTRYIPLRSSALGITEQSQISREEIFPDHSSILFSFTDGYMEGSRAFKRLIQKVEQMASESMTLDTLQNVLDEVGKDFRLEDDRSLLLINCIKPSKT